MDMKRLYNVAIVAVVALVAALALSCNNDSDAVLTKQQDSISRYLTTSHQPKLVEESEVLYPDDETPFYTRWGLDIYRYIATYYDEGRNEQPEVMSDSTIDIFYRAYVFSGSAPSLSSLFATNDAETIDELDELNTEYEWSTDALSVRMGKGDLFSGLETALEGCRKGDSVEVYLTYNKAYGKHYVGLVPAKSSMVWYIDIVDVK
jgi:hypothetical protein